MPALKTLMPPVPPLSVMKIRIVFSRRPRLASISSSRAMFSSMLAIMAKKPAASRGMSTVRLAVLVGHKERPCGALVEM